MDELKDQQQQHNNPRSPGNRKGVKARFVDLLKKPMRNRGISVPSSNTNATAQQRQEQQQQQRSRTFSASSAPAAPTFLNNPQQRSKSARAATPSSFSSARRTSHARSGPLTSSKSARQPASHKNSFGASPKTQQQEIDNHSCSDNVTVEGLRSVATNQTISSVETVKASNKTDLPSVDEDSPSRSMSGEATKSPWNAFKRAIKPFKIPTDTAVYEEEHGTELAAVSKKQRVLNNRRRVHSFDRGSASWNKAAVAPVNARTAAETDEAMIGFTVLDQSVRGRLDGLDIMTLGSAVWANHVAAAGNQETATKTRHSPPLPWEDEMRYSVTGQSTWYTPAQLVQNMLWNSGGRHLHPQVILEGFLPGPEERWTVQIETNHHHQHHNNNNNNARIHLYRSSSSVNDNRNNNHGEHPPDLRAASTDENTASTTATDDDSPPFLSSHKLWSHLWGSDPVPSGKPNLDLLNQVGKELSAAAESKIDDHGDDDMSSLDDPLLSLAAISSIPIDVDEDTFIVSTRDHLTAIQDICTVPISEGRFDTAVKIFEKLVLGLPKEATSSERRYLRGAGLHNIGVLQLWQGNYEQAHASFTEALQERRKYMTNHADLVVTQCRQAQCLFAQEKLDEALSVLNDCLRLTNANDSVMQAKILNNLAVVHYHKGEESKALRHLANALEHQREWLDGDIIRRESIVYEASVSLSNMGKVYLRQKDYELCSSVYEESLLLQTSIFKKDHPSVMQAYVDLGWSKAMQGHLRTAIRLLESCLRVQTVYCGTEAAATIETAGWMAHLYARSQKYPEALILYQQILQWQNHYLCPKSSNDDHQHALFFLPTAAPSSHPAVQLVKDCIRQIETQITVSNNKLSTSTSSSSLSIWL